MKFLTIIFILILFSSSVFAGTLERGVISTAGGRVRPLVSCHTLDHSRYIIDDLHIYDFTDMSPTSIPDTYTLQFSLNSKSRHPSCNDDNFNRSSLVVKGNNQYTPYVDPRHRSRLNGFILKFQDYLGDGFVKAILTSPSNSLPCNNLLPENAEINMICKILD